MYTDSMEAERQLRNYYNNIVLPKLDPQILFLLREYSDNFYGELTNYLLNEEGDIERIEMIRKSILTLRRAISLCRLPIPLTIYHGTSSEIFGKSVLSKKRNITFISKTFMSTSLNPEIASLFTKLGKHNQPVLLGIDLPINYPALWMGNISIHDCEDEILLPNETTLETSYFVKDKEYIFVKCRPVIK